ncbi:MAG: UDP-N-acetylenolpyruvoylglucosamine reductase, partial [Firmicutes bacterium]|nr:UDP-N-acetylenolpyruvoylglucosamine reductase [Bacillota bacterium]
NKDNATATDVINLMKLIQNTVYDKYGVKLTPEVRIIGRE